MKRASLSLAIFLSLIVFFGACSDDDTTKYNDLAIADQGTSDQIITIDQANLDSVITNDTTTLDFDNNDSAIKPDSEADSEISNDIGVDIALSTCGNNWDPEQGSWSYLGTNTSEAFSSGEVSFTRIALDSNNQLVAAYALTTPTTGAPKVEVMRWNGSAFDDLSGSTDVGDQMYERFDLAISSSDAIWIAGQSTGASSAYINAFVYHYDGTSWQTPTNLTTTGKVFNPVLAIGDNGQPSAAYIDQNYTIIGMQYYDGTSWQDYLPKSYDSFSSARPLMAFYGTTPYVLFTDGLGKPILIKHNGKTWDPVGPMATDKPYFYSASDAKSISMTFDSKGQPWVFFRGGSNPKLLSYQNNAWIEFDTTQLKSTVDTSSIFDTTDIKIVDDVPVIAYRAVKAPKGIRVLAYCSGNQTWTPLAGDSTAACISCRYPQLAVAPQGKIYLGYRDYDNAKKMSVKVFTRK